MTLTLRQNYTAISPGRMASFYASGGTEPYVFAVVPGGAGGSINASTGVYTGPSAFDSDPKKAYDTITVTDDDSVTTQARILVGSPLLLFCEIIQRELNLDDGRVYLWDQKIMQPSDHDLYVAVSIPYCKPFANVNRPNSGGSGLAENQYVSMLACLDIDIISRGPAARDRKEEVILALNSTYAQQQQEANSFYIGKLPPAGRFVNLSLVDGAAIPYRFRISVNIQYCYAKNQAIEYFDDYEDLDINIDPEGDSP